MSSESRRPANTRPSWNFGKLAFTLALAVYFGRHVFHPYNRLFIYNVDFVFHEAGHLVFQPFGELLFHLGGTLMQLLLPTAALLHLAKRQQYFSASQVLYWLGENWINISIYARDARNRALPLHGGDAVTHDWSEILLITGGLHYDHVIGNTFFAIGVLCTLAALGLGIYLARFSEPPLDDAQ